jgi:hypothetical protein
VTLITVSMEKLATALKMHSKRGLFDGQNIDTAYFAKAKRVHAETGAMLLFTRDVGYHSSGWFKNPDYERCYQLSLSFWDLENEIARPFEQKLAQAWVQCIFGQLSRYVWEESQPTESRKLVTAEVRHYRVFCDPAWNPIIPRGEVYTRDFIEIGWKSWSDKQYELKGNK